MGTGRPHVEITAATLAGGEKNQDRYAYGDGWAFVLDGASSFATEQPEHDGGWYAEHLKRALSKGLTDNPERTSREIVEDAIRAVVPLHGGDADSCPTSTIALARWDCEAVDVYVLGDSTAALISDEGEKVLSDTRITEIAPDIRKRYRSRLSAGHGFDERHRDLLQQLQARQAVARNRPEGYWIAGPDVQAADHGITCVSPKDDLRSVVLASDGAALGIAYEAFPSWAAFANRDTDIVLRAVRSAEECDKTAAKWPRSKPHDDKTAVVIHFRGGNQRPRALRSNVDDPG